MEDAPICSIGAELRLTAVLENALRALERMTHRFQALNLQLQHVAFLEIWVPAECANDATHQAFLWVVAKLALNSAEARLLSEEHVVRGLDASLLTADI